MKSKVVFVVGFVKTDGSGEMAPVPARLREGLTLPVNTDSTPRQGKEKQPIKLDPCRSFRTAREQLASQGICLTKGYVNAAGKAVFVFNSASVEEEDSTVATEFDKLFHQTGWSVFKYNNDDDSTVYAVHGAVDLADMVKAEGQAEKVARDWSKTEVAFQ